MTSQFTDEVIPEHDKDPVHSTTRHRHAALAGAGGPIPDIEVPFLPSTALLPLGR